MAWNLDTGLCSFDVVIDAGDVLWRGGGCENGWPRVRRVRRLRPGERAALIAAMSRLPVDRGELTPAEVAPVLAAFAAITRMPSDVPCHLSPTITRGEADGRVRVWGVERCALE